MIWTSLRVKLPEMMGGMTLYSGLKIRIAAAETAIEMPTVAIRVELSKPGLPMTGRMKIKCIRYANAAAASTPIGRATRIGRFSFDTTKKATYEPTTKMAPWARFNSRTAPQTRVSSSAIRPYTEPKRIPPHTA